MADPRTQLVADAYDAVGPTFAEWRERIVGDPREEWEAELAGRLLEGARVLELGCGPGTAETRRLARRFRLTGVDISPRQVDRARAAVPEAEFLCADFTALELPEASFAGAISFYVLNHVPRELLAPLLEADPPPPPFVALLVSGGHSMLIEVSAIGHYRLLGDTLDDAAGEAFDKTAKLMGLPYPGGPALAKLAESGAPGKFKFSRPMTDRPGLDFSFSGLKTQVLLAYQQHAGAPDAKADIARAFEDAIVETLLIKCRRALQQTGATRLVIAGGVGANRRLRAKLEEMAAARGGRVRFPRPALCTDNGAMIAFAAALRAAKSALDPDGILNPGVLVDAL